MGIEWQGQFDAYSNIAKPLRDDDAAKQLLKRFMLGNQAQHQLIEGKIIALFDQISPDRVRDDLLWYYKDLVGLGPDLYDIVSRLSTAKLRQLVKLAPSLWKQLGTLPGLFSAIRTLTGRSAVYLDWFKYRWVCGETSLELDNSSDASLPYAIGGPYNVDVAGDCTYLATHIQPIDRYASTWSLLKIMDTGNTDKELLLDMIAIQRPICEKIEVQLLEFLDDMSLSGTGAPLWVVTGPDPVVANNVMTVAAGVTLTPRITCTTPAGLGNVEISTDFQFNSSTSAIIFQWYLPNSGAVGAMRLVLSTNSTRVMLQSHSGGSWVTVAQDDATRIELMAGVWFNIRIESFVIDGSNTGTRIYLDGNLILPTSGDRVTVTGANQQGGINFSFSGDSAMVRMSEVHILPLRYAVVQLSSGTSRRGTIDKTANF